MSRPRVFVSSWFFAPFMGSADIDLYKRLKHCRLDFEVVQVKGRLADRRLLEQTFDAVFERHEVDLEGAHPRTKAARHRFVEAVVRRASSGTWDALLSHSNEVPSHDAALRIKRSHPALPWVAYFGDVVSRNPYVPHMAEYPLFDDDCRIEAQTLAEADVVICNNPWQRELLLPLRPEARHDSVVVIPHAWDAQLLPPRRPGKNARFTFMHLGALYSVKRLARPVLEAAELLIQREPARAGTFEVLFVGDPPDGKDLAAWRAMQHADHVRFVPSVPYVASLELMQRADALVLIDGIFDTSDGLDASPFFPGKLADYAATGRPILAVSMLRGPTAELQRARGQPVSEGSPAELAALMGKLIDGAFAHPPPAPELEARRVGATMEAVIQGAISRAR